MKGRNDLNAYHIYGGRIVTPDRVIEHGTVSIENGRIVEVFAQLPLRTGPNDIDARGQWVLPGLIDTHSDAIEGEIQPRVRTLFSPDVAFRELERKLAGQGITTMYHSLSLNSVNPMKKLVRSQEMAEQIITAINSLSADLSLIRNRIHLRFDITNMEMTEFVIDMLRKRAIHQLSFNDHTPGQGEHRNIELYKTLLFSKSSMSEQEKDDAIAKQVSKEKLDAEQLQYMADLAHEQHIPIASHDDDSFEKLDWSERLHSVICEFPLELEVAKEAKRRGMYTVMGAPNVLMGRSQSGNISALEAIQEDAVDILCSDYYPPSLLQAVFKLHKSGYDMPYAVRLASLNPAKALRVDHETGSIEVGKTADLLLVRENRGIPLISTTLVEGSVVCQMNYRP
jgi:alpha-D-ribose 1-methylphosphonate 5-triphosphate diphosphatase